MPRRSPFAGLTDGPGPDAEVLELGRPTRAALGFLGAANGFLAALGLAALGYAAFGASGAPRAVSAVVGVGFLAAAVGLVWVAVRAVRVCQGLAFDAAAVWWRSGAALVRVPWAAVATVRLTEPAAPRGRSSVGRTGAVEVCQSAESVVREAVRQHPELAERVANGSGALRFAFRLPVAADEPRLAAALARFAPVQWRPSSGPAVGT
jgi:hypothetical protein